MKREVRSLFSIHADKECVGLIHLLRLRLAPEWNSGLIVRSPLKGTKKREQSDRTFTLRRKVRSLFGISLDKECVQLIFPLRLRLAPEWNSGLLVRSPLKGTKELEQGDRIFTSRREVRSL
jgi:hypothetical protein